MRSAYRREAQLIRWWIVDFGLLIERGVERQSKIHNPKSHYGPTVTAPSVTHGLLFPATSSAWTRSR